MSPKIVQNENEPQYGRGGQCRAVVCTAAWTDLRALLLALPSKDSSELVKSAVKHQLQVWQQEQDSLQQADLSHGRPLGVNIDGVLVDRTLGESITEDIGLLKVAFRKGHGQDETAAWTWDRVPYTIRCAGLAQCPEEGDRPRKKGRIDDEEHFVRDVDEWILQNETFLRALSRAGKAGLVVNPWAGGLIRLADIPVVCNTVSSVQPNGGTGPSAFKLARPILKSLPGYTVLSDKRRSVIYMQSSEDAFRASWSTTTNDLLRGLDWSHVFVAGGLVLGTLLTPSLPSDLPDLHPTHTPDEWKSSDIDMYIYGLDVASANVKIRHIAETYKKNLPQDAPFLIVRNSQTITLYSTWPHRRVQIVLKLVKDPREVLLNFDLDVCAVGYDGVRPWLLPRCIRALETGTNVFTMDLISGHYLGDRKATRDQRVFKYANKGYGIRILPSYIAALSTYATKERVAPLTRGERLYVDLSLDLRAAEARKWTEKVIQRYEKVGYGNSPFHWPRCYSQVNSKKPVVSHAMLESYAQVTSEPLGRSCLTGFTLFMRHVALWEQEAAGNIVIYDGLWATDTYGDCQLQEVAYDDSPAYAWDSTFTVNGFKRSMDDFNAKEREHIKKLERDTVETAYASVARLTYSESIDEILTTAKDIVIPVVMPSPFFDFADQMLTDALQRIPNADVSSPLTIIDSGGEWDEGVLVLWRLDSILNWQMLDRQIDEIREALWSFHRAYERCYILDPNSVYNILRTNLSRRAIRTNVQDEMESWVRWVARVPYHEDTKLNAHYMLGYEDGEDEAGEDHDGEDDSCEDDSDE